MRCGRGGACGRMRGSTGLELALPDRDRDLCKKPQLCCSLLFALLSTWNHVGTQRGSVILMTERACEQTSEGHRAQRCTMRFEDRERDARCEMQRAKQRTGVHAVSAQ